VLQERLKFTVVIAEKGGRSTGRCHDVATGLREVLTERGQGAALYNGYLLLLLDRCIATCQCRPGALCVQRQTNGAQGRGHGAASGHSAECHDGRVRTGQVIRPARDISSSRGSGLPLERSGAKSEGGSIGISPALTSRAHPVYIRGREFDVLIYTGSG